MSRVQARRDRGFRRAYRPPRARSPFVRQLGIVVALLAPIAAGGVWLIDAARRSPLLAIDTITVDGHRRLALGEVLGLVDGLRGQNLFAADIAAGRASLRASGWVRDAAVRRVLPSTVHVTIDERTPVALGRFGGRLYLVDAAGAIVDEFGPRFGDLDLPIVDGLAAAGPAGATAATGPAAATGAAGPVGADGGSVADSADRSAAGAADAAGGVAIDPQRAALAARVIAEVGADPRTAPHLSQVDVANPHDAVVLLGGDPVRVHLGETRFAARLGLYLDIAETLRERVPDADAVDMRFGQRVYVRPASGGGAARVLEASS